MVLLEGGLRYGYPDRTWHWSRRQQRPLRSRRSLILPQVAVIVSQCGHGTVMKTLAYGVPLVCLPLLGDQPDIAARVVHAEAGVRLPQDASSTAIRTAIQRVMTEPGFRNGAQRLAKAMASEDGAKTAADELETLAVHSSSQVTRAP